MTKIARHDGANWWFAPWNDGAGGEYSRELDCEVLGYMELLIETPVPNAHYLVSFDDQGLPSTYVGLPLAHKKLRGQRATVAVSATSLVVVDGYPAGWVSNLVNSSKVILSVIGEGEASTLVWLLDGGRAAWELERRLAEQDAADARERQANAKLGAVLEGKRASGDYFINPYTFVPLPKIVRRRAPRGHHRLAGDGVSGWFTWKLSLVTDLVLPSDHAHPIDAILDYPGSSLRGALRSMHETIAGGCMRVLNETYVPIHRDPMNSYRPQTDTLAVVTKLDANTRQVTEVELTDTITWVRSDALVAGVPGGQTLYSGFEVSLDESARGQEPDPDRRRFQITDPEAVRVGSGWVVHVTRSFKQRDDRHYYCAVGRKTGQTFAIEDGIWHDYVAACEGGADLINVSSAADTSMFSPGESGWPSEFVEHGPEGAKTGIGLRRKADGWLSKGDTVWLTGDWRQGQGALKMAVIWRSHGVHSVRERLGSLTQLPCTKPHTLCPTCAVFGSVNTVSDADHEQDGYRTHVQVHWARTETPVTAQRVTLPPLRSPKPSSGGFYLTTPPNSNVEASPREDHITKSHWGSALDRSNAPRSIRGRKYYWHGQEPAGRQVARNHTPAQNDREAMKISVASNSGSGRTALLARVTFENLDAEQLGWLLAAADPRSLLGTACYLHIGRGKPLGYGTVEPEITDLHLWSASSRYGGTGEPKVSADQALELVRSLVESQGLGATHDALRRVLSPGSVHADRLSYPTALNFSRRQAKEFDGAYAWFGAHSGGRRGKDDPADQGRMLQLPEAIDPDQYLDRRKEQ